MIRISNLKTYLQKANCIFGIFENWSEEVFVNKKVKIIAPRTYVISDLKGEEIIRTFYQKELQKKKKKKNQNEFRVGKLIKRKGDKLYVKWKGYD